jgi:uncharacterized protein (DUF58 family)
LAISSTPLPYRSSPDASRPAVRSAGFPFLFHWASLIVFAGVTLYAAVQRLIPLLALSLFILVLGLISWLWSRWSLRSTEFRLSLPQTRAFPGESIEVSLELNNRKWLPLPWVTVELELPYRLIRGRGAPSPFTRERWAWASAVGGGQGLKWKQTLNCQQRGDYLLGPVRLRSGDLFGLYPVEKMEALADRILVYPRVVPVDLSKLRLTGLAGERAVPRTLYDDTSRTMGARDYQSGDSFKRIHWKASARRGELQARVYESTTSLSAFLVLDTTSFSGNSDDDFELAVTAIASLASAISATGAAVGMAVLAETAVVLQASSGRDRFLDILEVLARVDKESGNALVHEERQVIGGIAPGALVVIAAGNTTPRLAALVADIYARGHNPLVIMVEPEVADIRGAPVMPLSEITGRLPPLEGVV